MRAFSAYQPFIPFRAKRGVIGIPNRWGYRRIGIGLGGVSYYDNSFAFADLAKHGNIVQSNFAAYTAFDSLRNPTTNCLMVITSARLKNGVYKLKFSGKCDTLAAGGNAITLTNQVYNSGTNITTADVTLTNEAESSNRWISFGGSHVTDAAATNTGVTNISLMRPGYTTEKFTSEFLVVMSNASILRGMDWTATNSNDSVTWTDRHTPLHQGVSPTRGASWEELVMLANETSNDLWINVPAKANDDYVTKLAQLIKYGSDGTTPYTSVQVSPVYPPLNPDLCVYTEYGNEVWNPGAGFSCFGWALTFANTYKSDVTHPIAYDGVIADQYLAHKRWVAYRASTVSLAFRAVFGDAAIGTRVKPMFCVQTQNSNAYLEEGLNWAKGFYGTVRGSAPLNPTIRAVPQLWYGASGAAYLDSTANSPADSSAGSLNAYFAGAPAPEYAARIRVDLMWMRAWGLKCVAYEGGPEPGGSYLGSSASPGSVSAAINNDPRMAAVVTAGQSLWDSYGCDEFVYYVYSGAGNAWSFTNNVTPPLVADSATPKLLAFSSLTGSKSAATFGLNSVGTYTLKTQTNEVMGGNLAAGYQSGACYALASVTGYIYVAVLSQVVKTRRIALKMMNTVADVLTVSVNGAVVGTITPTVETLDVVRQTPYVVATFPVGVSVIAIRKAATTGNSYVRDIVLSSNDVKTINVNLTNGVNLDIADAQAVVSISRV